MSKQTTMDREMADVDLGNTLEVQRFFIRRAAATGAAQYVNGQLVMAALKLMSASQIRELLYVLLEAEDVCRTQLEIDEILRATRFPL